MKRSFVLLVFVVFGWLVAGCTESDSAADKSNGFAPPPDQDPIEIVESDLYQLDKERQLLFIHNERAGLSVIDVSDPRQPELLDTALDIAGEGGELYVQGKHAVILLEQATSACRCPDDLPNRPPDGAEIIIVDAANPRSLRTVARYCAPGVRVASRMINDFLFFITSSEKEGSRVYTLDLSNPEKMKTLQRVALPWRSEEVHVTEDRIFLVGPSPMPAATWLEGCEDVDDGDCVRDATYPAVDTHTRVQVISMSAKTGKLTVGGDIVLDGLPQGRFHIDARDGQLRIVTFQEPDWATRQGQGQSILHVLDVSDPSEPRAIGRLDEIGSGEQLYATRFVNDRAYVVTFRQTDPLWVIDLSDPSEPQIVGELHVPGWSDFIFPRGDRLLCVGRGDRGGGVGVSLFDVSDPRNPMVVEQLQLGDWDSQSEANMDHRAITILEDRESDRYPLLVLPFSGYGYHSCADRRERIALIEVTDDGLVERAELSHNGAVRRTFEIETSLLSISETELQSTDIADLDAPRTQGSVMLGDPSEPEYDYCSPKDYMFDDEHPKLFGCNLVGGESSANAPLPLLLLAVLALIRRCRRS